MTRFVLSILPDDRALLTSEEVFSQAEFEAIREAWRRWEKGLLVIADCRAQNVKSVELILDDGAFEVVPA